MGEPRRLLDGVPPVASVVTLDRFLGLDCNADSTDGGLGITGFTQRCSDTCLESEVLSEGVTLRIGIGLDPNGQVPGIDIHGPDAEYSASRDTCADQPENRSLGAMDLLVPAHPELSGMAARWKSMPRRPRGSLGCGAPAAGAWRIRHSARRTAAARARCSKERARGSRRSAG